MVMVKLVVSKGYTILELIVVIVILGISLHFIMPSLKKPNSVKSVARRVITMAGHLRCLAVRTQEQQILSFDPNGFKVSISGKTETDMLDDEERSNQGIPLPEDVILNASYPNGDTQSSGEINFYPTGYANPVAIHLTKDEYDYLTLVVEPFLSKVRIYDEYWEFPQR
jgi:prepilin-type N-terminal cleavage/methylation domain-containing protein